MRWILIWEVHENENLSSFFVRDAAYSNFQYLINFAMLFCWVERMKFVKNSLIMVWFTIQENASQDITLKKDKFYNDLQQRHSIYSVKLTVLTHCGLKRNVSRNRKFLKHLLNLTPLVLYQYFIQPIIIIIYYSLIDIFTNNFPIKYFVNRTSRKKVHKRDKLQTIAVTPQYIAMIKNLLFTLLMNASCKSLQQQAKRGNNSRE